MEKDIENAFIEAALDEKREKELGDWHVIEIEGWEKLCLKKSKNQNMLDF